VFEGEFVRPFHRKGGLVGDQFPGSGVRYPVADMSFFVSDFRHWQVQFIAVC
jgi:hypothetical protein